MKISSRELQRLAKELQRLVGQAKSELAAARNARNVDNVSTKYVGKQGLISRQLNSEAVKMNKRWASWRRHRRAVCQAITVVQVAMKERYEEIDTAQEAAKEGHRL